MSERRANWIFAAAILAFVVSQTVFVIILGPLNSQLLSVQLSFSSQDFFGIISGWSAEDIDRFVLHLKLDYLHAVIYGFALVFGALRLHTLNPQEPLMLKILIAAPLAAIIFDWTENTVHLIAIQQFSDGVEIGSTWILLSGIAASIKWTLILGALAYLVWKLPRAYLLNR